MAKDKGPLDDQTTIDLDLVSEKSVDYWLKLLKAWDGTSKLSRLDKVLRLETFFTVCFDPFRLDTFKGLEDEVTECIDGEDDEPEPGCGAEFYAGMRCCPFCTRSESDDANLKPDSEVAEYLIRVHDTKVTAPKKAPVSPIAPKVEQKPVAQPLVKVQREREALPLEEALLVTAIQPQTNAVVATVEELDAAVERAVTTYASAAQNAYECAVELKEIHDRQLWRQRRREGDAPTYKHFNDFVEAELKPRGIDRPRAYGLMDMATKFTREEFAKLGPAKMTVLVSMEPAARKQLVEETIERGLPLSEVRERKEEIRAQASSGSGRGAATGERGLSTSKGRNADPVPEAERSFTMVFPRATFRLELVQEATWGRKPKAATALADFPVGEVQGINGMRLRIALRQVRKDGPIVATGTLTREE